MPITAGQGAEFRRWLAGLARDEVEVFIANPLTAIEAGLQWVRPMLRTAEERELLALAMHELHRREAADRKRERRREEVRWAITTLVAVASLATSAAVVLRSLNVILSP
jgi:hypothetical protein